MGIADWASCFFPTFVGQCRVCIKRAFQKGMQGLVGISVGRQGVKGGSGFLLLGKGRGLIGQNGVPGRTFNPWTLFSLSASPADTRQGLWFIRIFVFTAISLTRVIGSATMCGRPGSGRFLGGLWPFRSAARSGCPPPAAPFWDRRPPVHLLPVSLLYFLCVVSALSGRTCLYSTMCKYFP